VTRLDETIASGKTGHIAAHAALKADYVARGGTPTIPDYTTSSTESEHQFIHAALHADHNALGNRPTLSTSNPAGAYLDAHAALHQAYNARKAVSAARTYTVTPTGDYHAVAQKYLTKLANRSDKTTQWTLQFAPGTYNLPTQWTVTGLQNVHITSQDPSNPAILNKGPRWSGEYLLRMYYGSNIRVSHLNFNGNLVYDPADQTVHWGDQGIWFASCHDTRVDHCRFSNIGNAAIRHNTKLDDARGVHSWNHVVEDNTFTNCWQVTTTQEGGVSHGGSYNWTVQRNTFTTMRGAVKFASRTAGCHTAKILNNRWTNATDTAIELSSVDGVEIRGNSFTNTGGALVNAYTNNINGMTGFPWARGITFADNKSNRSGDGFRLSMNRYPDGYQPHGSNLVLTNNTIAGVSTTDKGQATVRVVYGGVTGVTLTNNRFSRIANKRPRSFDRACTGVKVAGNTLDGSPHS